MNLQRLLMICLFVSASGATVAQPITMYRTFGGVRFERDTLNLTLRQVSDILSVNPVAHEQFRIAKRNYHVAGIMGFSGAVLLVVPAVTTLAGGDPEWLLAGAGGALILGSIPFSISFRHRAINATDMYNNQLPAGRKNIQFFWRGNSAGIRF